MGLNPSSTESNEQEEEKPKRQADAPCQCAGGLGRFLTVLDEMEEG